MKGEKSMNFSKQEQKLLDCAETYVPRPRLTYFIAICGGISGIGRIAVSLRATPLDVNNVCSGFLILGFFALLVANQRLLANACSVILKLKGK